MYNWQLMTDDSDWRVEVRGRWRIINLSCPSSQVYLPVETIWGNFWCNPSSSRTTRQQYLLSAGWPEAWHKENGSTQGSMGDLRAWNEAVVRGMLPSAYILLIYRSFTPCRNLSDLPAPCHLNQAGFDNCLLKGRLRGIGMDDIRKARETIGRGETSFWQCHTVLCSFLFIHW